MPVDFDTLWDYAQPRESEERLLALLPEAERAGDLSYLGQLLTQIGRAQGLQGNVEGANRTLDRVDTLPCNVYPVVRIRAFLERGRVLNSFGQPQESIPYLLDAWRLAREYGEDFHAIDAAHMLGIVEPPGEQVMWSAQALELAESSEQPRARTWLGPLYNDLGWSHHDLGRYEDALELFRRSLSWRRAQEQPREIRVAAWTIARCLRSLGRIEEALDLQRENLNTANEVGDPRGEIEEEIGECLLALGRSAEARQHFRRAHQELSSDDWVVEHEASRLARLQELARR